MEILPVFAFVLLTVAAVMHALARSVAACLAAILEVEDVPTPATAASEPVNHP